MLKYLNKTISGWGKYPKVNCNIYRPEDLSKLSQIINSHNNTIIARGMGMSYGDAALNQEGTIDTSRIDNYISFDTTIGSLHVESGTTLAEIINVITKKGWFLPVLPGTKYVSVGGAIASDVHGKNQYKEFGFGNHVEQIKLRMADGNLLTCSKQNNPEIFAATIGGMGMTGIIEEANIKLKPIQSVYLDCSTQKVYNIHEMLDLFVENKEEADYMVGWIDHFTSDDNIGRGIFEKATHKINDQASLHNYKIPKQSLNIPPIFPTFVLNKYSMALYNKIRFHKYNIVPKEEVEKFDNFFHPLDKIKNWNNLYGNNGFLQYQCIIPENNDSAENLQTILSTLKDEGIFSFLAVIKYHNGQQNAGIMSFPINGYSLALDFANTKKIRAKLLSLSQIICDMGGRVYLAKDAILTNDIFESMYEENLKKWRKILKEIDPNKKFNSHMAERLNFRGGL